MHRRKSWNRSGVSEVIGTILILGMTVVLFSTIIVWVASIPTPEASIRLDMDGRLNPIYDDAGAWIGANITVDHRGGESLVGERTQIFLVVEGAGGIETSTLATRGVSGGIPYGIDGPDTDWDVGERWSYTNYTIDADDRVTMTVVDRIKSIILWSEPIAGTEGDHPPLFLEKWTDRFPATPTIDVPLTNKQFTILARVTDADGDLNRDSVFVYLAFLYGTPSHRAPQRMYDDGTHGDLLASDDVFTSTATFYNPPTLDWDGGIVLFNATDMAGHKIESRMTLEVQEGPPAPKKSPGGFGDGRPPNLNYNGLQGFNIFNGTEWDTEGFNATETRTFKEAEEVVVIVGSAILTDTFGANRFFMYDPFSSLPLDPVVYGTDKTVTTLSNPSSTEAFEFLLYVNGYNVWIQRFALNNVSVGSTCTETPGVCFHKTPARPPQYFFSAYPIEITIVDFLGNRFAVSDTINITANDGYMRTYPSLETFKDSGFTQRTNTFRSTDVIYVRVIMKTVDTDTSKYAVGNIVIQDFIGGQQLFRAPLNGHDVNVPICPVTLACNPGNLAVGADTGSVSYRFSLNLTLANQDPWVEGRQHYSLKVLSLLDSDEEYSLVLSAQLVITAPLYRMDYAVATDDVQNQAWGTHDVSYYFLNRNGVDQWRMERLHQGATKAIDYTKAISYLDFDLDGDLDIVASLTFQGAKPVECPNKCVFMYRQNKDADGNLIWTRSLIEVTGNVFVNDIRTGSLNKDRAPEIVVGADNGAVWYYKNDGSWTKTTVDTSRTGAVNAIDLGDFDGDGDLDIAVARQSGGITYYPNLDGNGKFTTTAQTDYWYAQSETTVKGQITGGSYVNTYPNPTADDNVYEDIEERTYQQSASYLNRTANSDNYTSPGTRTSGTYVTTQTQDDVPQILTETQTTGTRRALTHKWTMSLPTSGTKTFYIDAYRNAGADDTFTFSYSTDNTTFNNLVTVTATSDTDNYLTANIPSSVNGLIWIRVIDSQQNNGESTDSIRVDHMYVETYYSGGSVSAMEHYWQMQTLPNRAGSTITFYIRALREDNGNEGDNFQFAYSTTGQNGAYTNLVLVNQAAETLFSATLPAGTGGQTVWIRVTDTDSTVGATVNARLRVDLMYIEVYTPGGVTGSDISFPGDGSASVALDAGDYNLDGYDDAFAGTVNGNVFRMTGSSGGLQAPGGTFATGLGTIGGIKVGNVTMAAPGFEVAVASGTLVRVFRSDTGGLLSSTAAVPNGQTITSLSMGDVDGDEDDDIVVSTTGSVNTFANVVYFRNNPGGWATILVDGTILGKIWDGDLGDMSKSQYLGR